MTGKKGSNQYIKAREMGLNIPIDSDEKRRKCSVANKARSSEFNRENGRKISEAIQRKVKEGTWHTSLSRRMHIDYNGIDLHGTWELAYAMYLDSKGIRWRRCKESFPYRFNNVVLRYTPDFYLIDTNQYVEIKGYETEKDRCKWNQFSGDNPLVILKENDLKELKII